jgi:eukaryotic-like serine/threonine-protein kinase
VKRVPGPGDLVAGRYRLELLLRKGGMGSVFRATREGDPTPVAVKILDPAIAKNPQMLGRFLREARTAAALESPNVVRIHEHGVEDGNAFIAMELLDGESLRERLAKVGRLPPPEAFRLVHDVLRAVGRAHDAGIIHRDIKPDNVFVEKGEPERAKILDFGVAKVLEGAPAELLSTGTQTGMMLGTPYYMSPEQAQAKEVDHRTDLFAVAVVAFEALTGQRPFRGESFGDLVLAICASPVPIPSRVGAVPPGFDEWFVRATQRDRERRFASAREMAAELERIALGHASIPPHRPRAVTPMLSPAPPRSVSVRAPEPTADELGLTTGQRSVVSSGTSGRPAPQKTSVALLALYGVALFICVAVGVFVLRGGARSFRDAKAADARARAPAASPLPSPIVAPPPSASTLPAPPAAAAGASGR